MMMHQEDIKHKHTPGLCIVMRHTANIDSHINTPTTRTVILDQSYA